MNLLLLLKIYHQMPSSSFDLSIQSKVPLACSASTSRKACFLSSVDGYVSVSNSQRLTTRAEYSISANGKSEASIPIISKLADARHQLSPIGMEMLETDIQAAHIYDTIVSEKFKIPTVSEFSREIVIIE